MDGRIRGWRRLSRKRTSLFADAHDIDRARIDLEPQHVRRLRLVMQHVAIRLAQRVSDHAVADEAAVDERSTGVAPARARGLGIRRTRAPAGERIGPRPRRRRRRDDERVAEQRGDALRCGLRRDS
jgi:hypothetical protein